MAVPRPSTESMAFLTSARSRSAGANQPVCAGTVVAVLRRRVRAQTIGRMAKSISDPPLCRAASGLPGITEPAQRLGNLVEYRGIVDGGRRIVVGASGHLLDRAAQDLAGARFWQPLDHRRALEVRD